MGATFALAPPVAVQEGHPDSYSIELAPTPDLREIRNVVTVFKDGVGYDSKKLIDSVEGLVGIR